MVLPAASRSSAASRSAPAPSRSLLKKKSHPPPHGLQQSRLAFPPAAAGAAGSTSGSLASSSSSAPLRQASIFQLAGVVKYSEEDFHDESVPTTLYLGEADILKLKATLLEQPEHPDRIMKVLRRLSTVPCTRQVLESTRIGVAVGKLRQHDDDDISELAERIVAVWKRQLKEHDAQRRAHGGGPSQHHSSGAAAAARRR